MHSPELYLFSFTHQYALPRPIGQASLAPVCHKAPHPPLGRSVTALAERRSCSLRFQVSGSRFQVSGFRFQEKAFQRKRRKQKKSFAPRLRSVSVRVRPCLSVWLFGCSVAALAERRGCSGCSVPPDLRPLTSALSKRLFHSPPNQCAQRAHLQSPRYGFKTWVTCKVQDIGDTLG